MTDICGNAEKVLSAYAPPPLWNVEIVCAYDTTPDDRTHKRIKRFFAIQLPVLAAAGERMA